MVIGFAIVSALLISISMLFPASGRPKERAQRVKCGSNLRQIGQAIALYINDHRAFPASLGSLHMAYGLSWECFVCPNTDYWPARDATPRSIVLDLFLNGKCTYVYLGAGLPLDVPAETVLAHEMSIQHHKAGMNVLFADGHVEFITAGPTLDRILKPTTRPIVLPLTSP